MVTLIFFSCSQLSVQSHRVAILITLGNVRYLANFIHSGATIDSRSIRFGSGTANEKLLQVPIAAAGELDAHASIRVTVGLTCQW